MTVDRDPPSWMPQVDRAAVPAPLHLHPVYLPALRSNHLETGRTSRRDVDSRMQMVVTILAERGKDDVGDRERPEERPGWRGGDGRGGQEERERRQPAGRRREGREGSHHRPGILAAKRRRRRIERGPKFDTPPDHPLSSRA